MRFLLPIFIFFASILASYAQPGYQGKKLSFGYNLVVSPAFSGPTYNGGKGIGAFNLMHTGRVDYVLTRKTAIGLLYSFSRTGVNYTLNVFGNNIYKGNPLKAISNGIGINYRVFFGGATSLAPIGKYLDLEVQLLTTLVKDKLIGQDVLRTHYFLAAFSLGRQKVIFNSLLLDYGVRFGLVPQVISSYLLSSNTQFDNNGHLTGDVKGKTALRIFSQQVIGVRLGLSFLAK